MRDLLNFTIVFEAHTAHTNGMKQKVTIGLKAVTVLSAVGGVLLGLFDAERAGYSHWSRRLLYFTAQSNLWLGVTVLMLLLSLARNKERAGKWYLFRYVFTASIVLTGLVFCLILAPFAGKSYHPWSLSNILTHVATPLLALSDLVIDRYPVLMGAREITLCVLPPLGYVTLASLLGLFGVDFGRGVTYPYFFMNYCSPVGLFGMGGERPFVLGAVYWILLLLLVTLLVAKLLARLQVRRMR